MSGTLDGIKVLDVSHFISGPTCGSILARKGAEVIKAEPPLGDTMRLLTSAIDEELEQMFCQLNVDKKGITLNLKSEKGAEILRELALKSDVLIENLRPGAMDKYGLGYEDLKEKNPELIYVSISGFGRTGPKKGSPAFDLIAQATGGTLPLMGMLGNKPKMFIADVSSGIFAALGAIEALYHREKTGEGQLVDISMQDVVFTLNLGAIVESVLPENKLKNMGMSFTEYPPGLILPLYGMYEAEDGQVAICAITEGQAKRLFEAMGEENSFEEYDTFLKRYDKDKELRDIVNSWTSDLGRDEIVDILQEANVPCGPVYQPREVQDDEQLRSRDMLVETEYKGMDTLLPGIVVKLSKAMGDIENPAPELGEHTEEVLRDLGYSEKEIEEFKEEGVC